MRPRLGALLMSLVATGCGRIGFDDLGAGSRPSPRTLAAGDDFTCAIRDSSLTCWGGNTAGQLGIGTNERQTTPAVVALADPVEIEAGGVHACARDAAGDVWCWGDNTSRQLGDGSMTSSSVPVRVTGLPRPAIDLAAGSGHSCAVLDDGDVWCWGANSAGQSGTNPSMALTDPVRVPIDGVVEVVAGGQRGFIDGHTCARRNGSELWCWGSDYYGQQFSTGDSAGHPTPTRIDLDVATMATGGGITCVVRVDGHLACAGYAASGALAGAAIDQPSPLGDLAAVDYGFLHGCALSRSGDVSCWGMADRGQLGNDTDPEYRSSPMRTTLAEPAVEIAVGRDHACARLGGGDIACWGSGRSGQLGDGRGSALAPVHVQLAKPAISIGVGGETSCAVDGAGAVWCWGFDLIDNRVVDTPTQVAGVSGAYARVAIGAHHACALAGAGVWCWGRDEYKQLAGAAGPQPGFAFSASGDIVSGDYFSCAIDSADQVWCWGSKDYGNVPSADGSPGMLPGTSNDLGAGDYHSCMRATDGTARCWGLNDRSQLGFTGSATSATPVVVAGLPAIDAVVGGGRHTCAKAGSQIWCWGDDGTSRGIRLPPALISSTATDVGAGLYASCIILTGGTVQCWGRNPFGQLGDGTTTTRDDPTAVAGNLLAVSVDTSGSHTCARQTSGDVWCWGDNDKGQLGMGTQTRALAPILVPR